MGASSSVEIYLMQHSPLEFSVDIGDVSVDEDHRLLAMKKPGFGMKPFKKWWNEVDYHGDDPTHPSTIYWQSQYKKWQVYDFFYDPEKGVDGLHQALGWDMSRNLVDLRLKQLDLLFNKFFQNSGEDRW
ncbi:unnamed protein product [Calypogeia fissa]